MDTQEPVKSAAAFFRDPRMKRGLSTLPLPEAAALTKTFLKRYSYESCTPDQLLALADLALRAKELGSAREALNRALLVPSRVHLAAYKLGRLEVMEGDMEAAAALFVQGSQADPSFPYNWMGRAKAFHMLSQKARAAEAAERFASFGVRPHGADELALLADIADTLFEAGERRRCHPIYALISTFAAPTPRTVVRLAESLMAAENYAAALAVLVPAHEAAKLDLWGRRALAQCHSHEGNHEAAIALAEAVLTERPTDPGFVATYVDALVRSRDLPRWKDALQRFGSLLPDEAAAELSARIALVAGDVDRAEALLRDVPLRPHTRLFYVTLETGYAALDRGGFDRAEALADRLEAVAPGQTPVAMLRVDICMRQQKWEQAAIALRQIPADQSDHPNILLKWFEYSCFVGNTAEAERLAARLDSLNLPSRQYALPMLRFLAEQQRWSELADRAIEWIGADFNYDQIGYVLFRAAKRARRHADFLAAIEAVASWSANTDLVRLHTTLAWDRAGTLAEMERIALEAPASLSPAMHHRMHVQRQVFSRAAGPPGRRALFLCTNRNYLCATVVALHSALRFSAPGREDIFIVVDDDTADLTEKLMEPFRAEGFAVTVVPANQVVDAAEKLYPTYGLFTSGHVLASAAYYRIYFARYLQKTGRYERAIYIDSDVLVRVPLDGLFSSDLRGCPLAARVETPRPEVTRAIELHRLEGDLYFNSGILLFDMKSEVLGQALDDAVAAIMDDNTTLLFHDQCALNLGFRNRFRRLGMEWNFPVGEPMRVSDLPANTAIVHYLDRPKPWSAAYSGELSMMWFDEWRDTAALIGEAAAVELFGQSSD